MSLGFEQAGFDVVCAIERDPAHAGAHRFNFPDCELVQDDIARVDADRLIAAVAAGLARTRSGRLAPRVDVVIGGPPCQGFSVGGLRDPRDPRNRLVERFAWAVETLQPTAFVLENVPMMASRILPGHRRPIPQWLTGRLSAAGYRIDVVEQLNASRFGVPQDRRRLLILGRRRDAPPLKLPGPSHAPPPRHPGRSPRPGELGHARTDSALTAGATVFDAIGDLAELDLLEVIGDQAAIASGQVSRSAYAHSLSGTRVDSGDLSAVRHRPPGVLTGCMRTEHTADVLDRFSMVRPGTQEPVSRLHRLHPDGLAPTLRAGSGPDRGSYSAPRPIHFAADRVITVREAARLHGFPDWFWFTVAKWHGFRQIGNAVPPPLARAVADEVRTALGLPGIVSPADPRLPEHRLLQVRNGAGRVRTSRPIAAATPQRLASAPLPTPGDRGTASGTRAV